MRAVSLIRGCRSVAIAAAVAGFAVTAGAQDLRPDIAREMRAQLRASFAYDASPEAKPAAPARAYGVILLKPYVVRSRYESEGLDASIAHQEGVEDRFTLGKGGTISTLDLGRVRAAVGVWYDADNVDKKFPGGSVPGLNVLKFAW
jgi:hypothetical protein